MSSWLLKNPKFAGAIATPQGALSHGPCSNLCSRLPARENLSTNPEAREVEVVVLASILFRVCDVQISVYLLHVKRGEAARNLTISERLITMVIVGIVEVYALELGVVNLDAT